MFFFPFSIGKNNSWMSNFGKSTNIVWHECPVGKAERQKLLKQKGCVIWITGLSGSGWLIKLAYICEDNLGYTSL